MDAVTAAASLVDLGFSPTQVADIMSGEPWKHATPAKSKPTAKTTTSPQRAEPVAKAIVNQGNITERLAALDQEVAASRVRMKAVADPSGHIEQGIRAALADYDVEATDEIVAELLALLVQATPPAPAAKRYDGTGPSAQADYKGDNWMTDWIHNEREA